MEVLVQLTTNKWHIIRRFNDTGIEFRIAHRLVQKISKLGLHTRIEGYKYSPSYGTGRIAPNNLADLEKWLNEPETIQAFQGANR